MLRLILGLFKGGVVGGAVGYGAYALRLTGVFHWVTYGLVGVAIGLLVGKPLWTHLRQSGGTIFTPILKAIVGYGICVGLYALVAKVWGGFDLELLGETRNFYDWQFVCGAALGGLYGAFVEVDDAEAAPAKKLEA